MVGSRISHRLIHLIIPSSRTGGVPSELGEMADLEHLILNDNPLEGTIPTELGEMKNLTHLYLCNDELTGNVMMGLIIC
jgi:Leucine-rich repeat (LRR) protein